MHLYQIDTEWTGNFQHAKPRGVGDRGAVPLANFHLDVS